MLLMSKCYFVMDSAKQTMCVKSVRFGYKNFVQASSDRYPYHLIPYSGAKGIDKTPGKDLTVWVVADLLLTCQDGKRNLTFDNWCVSSKLISLLTAMIIPTTCTVCCDCIGSAPITSKSQIERSLCGNCSYAYA